MVGIEVTSKLVTISQAAVALSLDVFSVGRCRWLWCIWCTDSVKRTAARCADLVLFCKHVQFVCCLLATAQALGDQRRVNVSFSCNHGAGTSAIGALAVACALHTQVLRVVVPTLPVVHMPAHKTQHVFSMFSVRYTYAALFIGAFVEV